MRHPPNTKVYMHEMYKWYQGRLVAGTQLSLDGHPVLNYDVLGDGPWYDWVSTDELINEVEQRTGYRVPKRVFFAAWKKVTQMTKRDNRKAYWPIKRGIHRMGYRNMTKFRSLRECSLMTYDHSGIS